MARPTRPAPRELTVVGSRKVTPNMLRLTLGGPGMAGFPPDQAGGYVKLQIRVQGQDKPVVRTYTIRAQRDEEIDVDFALHGLREGTAGPATDWALQARPGDTIMVGGPGPAKPLAEGAGRYLILGDMTALPAISVNLENLPADAQGIAILEVQSEEDKQEIAHPEGVEIRWLINPEPGQHPVRVEVAMREIAWPEDSPYAWVASEFSTMRAMRRYLREERGLGPNALYISSYWKHGLTEESHKIVKRDDAESLSA